MNLSSIYNGITGIFKSDDISDTLIATRDRLRDSTIPSIAVCIADTKTISFTNNPEYKATLSTVKRHYSKASKLELFPALAMILKDSEKTINELIPLVGKYFTKVVDKDSITYPRAQILALAETIDFVSNFIPRYCRFVIAKQIELSGGEKLENSLSKAQFKYIRENTLEFYKAIDSLSKINVDSIEKLLKAIPNVSVTEDNTENNLFSKTKLDPTGSTSRFLSASWNPLYYAQMALVDYQHARYKQSKEEVEAIKIDLDYLNSQIQNGAGDAYIERQRELAQERLNKVEYEISKYEDKARNTVY